MPCDTDLIFPVTPRPIRRTQAAVDHARRTPMTPDLAVHLLDRAFRALGRGWPQGFGVHTLRRNFATDLKDKPIKVVAKLGGWRDRDRLLRYQRVTDDDQRATLRARRRETQRPASQQVTADRGFCSMGPARFEPEAAGGQPEAAGGQPEAAGGQRATSCSVWMEAGPLPLAP